MSASLNSVNASHIITKASKVVTLWSPWWVNYLNKIEFIYYDTHSSGITGLSSMIFIVGKHFLAENSIMDIALRLEFALQQSIRSMDTRYEAIKKSHPLTDDSLIGLAQSLEINSDMDDKFSVFTQSEWDLLISRKVDKSFIDSLDVKKPPRLRQGSFTSYDFDFPPLLRAEKYLELLIELENNREQEWLDKQDKENKELDNNQPNDLEDLQEGNEDNIQEDSGSSKTDNPSGTSDSYNDVDDLDSSDTTQQEDLSSQSDKELNDKQVNNTEDKNTDNTNIEDIEDNISSEFVNPYNDGNSIDEANKENNHNSSSHTGVDDTSSSEDSHNDNSQEDNNSESNNDVQNKQNNSIQENSSQEDNDHSSDSVESDICRSPGLKDENDTNVPQGDSNQSDGNIEGIDGDILNDLEEVNIDNSQSHNSPSFQSLSQELKQQSEDTKRQELQIPHKPENEEANGKTKEEKEEIQKQLAQDIEDLGDLQLPSGKSAVTKDFESWKKKKLHKPKSSWKKIFPRMINPIIGRAQMGGKSDMSYAKRNPNQVEGAPLLMGFISYPPEVTMLIDASPSMMKYKDTAMSEFIGVMKGIFMSYAQPITVAAADSGIKFAMNSMTPYGYILNKVSRTYHGSSVDFGDTMEQILKKGIRYKKSTYPKPDILVVFTDGLFEWPFPHKSTLPSKYADVLIVSTKPYDELEPILPPWVKNKKNFISIK